MKLVIPYHCLPELHSLDSLVSFRYLNYKHVIVATGEPPGRAHTGNLLVPAESQPRAAGLGG